MADFGSPLAVIVTHPWGPLGGNYNNNVVAALVCWFQRLRVTTLRFDFVGSQIGRGYTQVDQVQEASQFLVSGAYAKYKQHAEHRTLSRPPTRILLVGYSYGSIVSASASSQIPECIGVASVAPPLGVRHWLFMFHGNYHLDQAASRSDLPQLMIMGSKDNFTSEDVFMDIVKGRMSQASTTGAVLKGADHFFRGREKDLMDILGTYRTAFFFSLFCFVILQQWFDAKLKKDR